MGFQEFISRWIRKTEEPAINSGKPIAHHTLEALVGKPSDSILPTFELPPVPKLKVVKQPAQEIPTYGKALREYFGWPEWFYDSQKLLRSWNIKGGIQESIAKEKKPEELKTIRARLEGILIFDTGLFIVYMPWVFKYNNSYLNGYISKLKQVVDLLDENFGFDIPGEFDWRSNPPLFKDLEAISDLEVSLTSLNSGSPEVEKSQRLRDDLKAYERKRILLLVRTKYKEDKFRRYLPSSAKLVFHTGEDIKGLAGQNFNYDAIIITGGLATHNIYDKLKSRFGENFYKKIIYAFDAVNPERVLTIMAENAYRFR